MTETGDPVPYAVVVMEPGFSQRFTGEDGRFAIPGVRPGSYRLMARQVGFQPFDSSITVGADPLLVRVVLKRVAIRLADLTVASTRRNSECRDPGRPDSSALTLATIFEQLRENAERQKLLVDQHPYRYWVARRFESLRRSGRTELIKADTTLFTSGRWRYAVGRVVTPSPDGDGQQNVSLPWLADFADSAFQSSHCYTLRGIETVDDTAMIRLDFTVSRRIRFPDVSGTAWLDPVTFQVRRTSVSLTEVALAAHNVREWTASTTFGEIRPTLMLPQRILARTLLEYDPSQREAEVARSEEQTLVRVQFLRPFALSPDSGR